MRSTRGIAAFDLGRAFVKRRLYLLLIPTFLVSAYFLHTVAGGRFSRKLDDYQPVEFASATAQSGLPDWAHPLTEDERFAKVNVTNHKRLDQWHACAAQPSCKRDYPNTIRMVLVQSNHFMDAETERTHVSKEQVVARSAIDSLLTANFTVLYMLHLPHLLHFTRVWQDTISAVILYGECDHDAFKCELQKDCVLGPTEKRGMPLWKFLTLDAGATDAASKHPLGHPWTLSAERKEIKAPALSSSSAEPPTANAELNTYAGYSIEKICMNVKFIPHAERGHVVPPPSVPPRLDSSWWGKAKSLFPWPGSKQQSVTPRQKYGYIMSKNRTSLASSLRIWPIDFYDEAFKRTGLVFDVGLVNDEVAHPESAVLPTVRPGLFHDHELLKRDELLNLLAGSSVLIGAGSSNLSPTPYEALCLGVPFINPILSWDIEHPQDRSKWVTEHDGLAHLDPPYVYNVVKSDEAGFTCAIEDALSHPIDRYILEHMKVGVVAKRWEKLILTNWRAMGQKVLDERIQSGVGNLFQVDGDW